MDSTLIGDILAGVFGTVVVGTTAAVVHSVVGKDKGTDGKVIAVAGKDDKKSGEEVQKGEFEAHSSEGDEELKGNGVVEVESFWKGPKTEGVPNPMVLTKDTIPIVSNRFLPINSCVPEGAFTLSDRQYKSEEKLLSAGRYLKAGPKTHLYYDPNKVRAAIVTCGGLCPGENVVVRELVMMLWYSYGVKDIYGVKYGYEGFWKIKDGKDCYVKLVPDFGPHIKNPPKDIIAVKDIHNIGGTILGSSRGGFDGERIADAIQKREINQIYAIGGDGTHRALLKLSKVFKKRGVEVTLIGIPKTIDNDMPLLDKTFGFDSAVEAAMWAIQCVDVEANSAEYGVGLIKVMGRSAGHIAMHAALANRDVNVCLLPEFPFDVYGPKGLLEYVMKRVKDRHHCVIVVAEGAALGMRDMKLGEEVRKDPSGNVIPEVRDLMANCE